MAERRAGLDSEPQGPLVESETRVNKAGRRLKLLLIKGVKGFCCLLPEMKDGAVCANRYFQS